MKTIIRCTIANQGFIGYYFEGTRGKEKAVIYMGGAGCSEKVCIESSEFLRRAGYSVLVLGFYLWKGLPKQMYDIPVEYAEKAAGWLHRKGYGKVIIMGTSTGAGYAMLSASLVPDINGAVLVSPFDHVMEGMKHNLFCTGTAVYQYRNKALPFAHYPIFDKGYLSGLREFRQKRGYDLPHIMRYAYDTAEYTEESRIKAENIRGDLLLIAPRVDDCWPSTQAVQRIEEILDKSGFAYRHRAVIYEKGSHALSYWKLTPALRFVLKLLCPAERNSPAACTKAREDSVREILAFIGEI